MDKRKRNRKAARLLSEAKHWQSWSRDERQHRLLRRRQLGTAQQLKLQAIKIMEQDDPPPAA